MSERRQESGLTFLFAGGGTGGHLIPGLSVAEELRRLRPESRQVFAVTDSGLDAAMVQARDFEFIALPHVKWSGSALSAPRWAFGCARAFVAARRALKALRPSVVVSLGGYAAVAPCIVARLAGTPLALMEQNALPGKANRLLSWWAAEVYAPWRGTEAWFARPERVFVTGNPLRGNLSVRRNRNLAARFGLSPNKKTLLVMGGSQGALSINRALIGALPALEKEASWLQILHSAGRLGCDEARAAYRGRSIQAAVYPFIEDMAGAYALSDLVVCRAGGTTLAELTALGIPAVLIPLPTAANDHQRRNASVIAGEGGAIIMDQADLDPERLASILFNLLRNEPTLARMRAASLRLGRPGATVSVANRLLNLTRNGQPCEPVSPLAVPAGKGG